MISLLVLVVCLILEGFGIRVIEHFNAFGVAIICELLLYVVAGVFVGLLISTIECIKDR